LPARPVLLVVSGPPGAGKTTLAHVLAAALAWPLISRDELKEGLVAAGSGPADRLDPTDRPDVLGVPDRLNVLANQAFFAAIGEEPATGGSLVAEAAFQDRLWRPGLAPLGRVARGERPIESWVPIALDVPALVVDSTRGWVPGLPEIVSFARHV
jgi:hypothetical protein